MHESSLFISSTLILESHACFKYKGECDLEVEREKATIFGFIFGWLTCVNFSIICNLLLLRDKLCLADKYFDVTGILAHGFILILLANIF